MPSGCGVGFSDKIDSRVNQRRRYSAPTVLSWHRSDNRTPHGRGTFDGVVLDRGVRGTSPITDSNPLPAAAAAECRIDAQTSRTRTEYRAQNLYCSLPIGGFKIYPLFIRSPMRLCGRVDLSVVQGCLYA